MLTVINSLNIYLGVSMSDGFKDALNSQINIISPTYMNLKAPIVNTIEFRGIMEPPKEGIKFDDKKTPVELLPTQALEEISKVLGFGAKKYDSWNWAKGFKWTRLIGATIRHLYAFQRGEDKDPESGLSHLAHAGCCILFLLQHELSNLGQDDRYKEFTKGENK